MKPGDNLGDYRLIRKLGEGGMSEVWLAEDSRIRHQVAVKVLHAQYARNPKIRKRLEIEAQALARLKHPNIVGMHHYIEHGDDVALVMEYVEGKNLDDYVRKETGPLPEEKLRAIFLQILDGIGHAHQQGIVHRDIKPSNFMITADGTVKVLDFGIAKVLEDGAEKLTRTGMRMGTTAYMSPEQVNVDLVDHLSDIYSLGVTLFFLATGRGVYEGEESDFKVQSKIVNEPLPAASGIYPGVPGYVERVIARATAKRKEERFQGCGEMRAALEGRVVTVPKRIGNNSKQVLSSNSSIDLETAFGLKMKMVLVEGGIFQMGTNHGRSDSAPPHDVSLKSFWIGQTLVTQAQWRAVMGSSPSYRKSCDKCPVENVSQNDCMDFINKLNKETGKLYRLPTEAEWEYAARGGKRGQNSEKAGGDKKLDFKWNSPRTWLRLTPKGTLVDRVAWHRDNCGGQTQPVGLMVANELGLFDMCGNVWEWCSDWYASEYYKNSPKSDPKGSVSGTLRVARGGSWYHESEYSSVYFRGHVNPDVRNPVVGFRLARD